jgi:hypothetical protein
MIIRHYLIAMIGPELSKSNEVQSNTQVRYCRSKKWRGEGTHLMIWRCLRVINVQQFCASLPQWKNQTTFMQSKSFLKITQRRHFSDHSDDWVLLKNTPEPGHYHWRRVSQNYISGLHKLPSSRTILWKDAARDIQFRRLRVRVKRARHVTAHHGLRKRPSSSLTLGFHCAQMA